MQCLSGGVPAVHPRVRGGLVLVARSPREDLTHSLSLLFSFFFSPHSFSQSCLTHSFISLSASLFPRPGLGLWSNQPTSEKQESQYNMGKKSSSTICIETFRLEHSPLDHSFISGENHIHHKRHKFTEYIRCNMQIVSSQTFANYFRLNKKCDL